MATYKLLSADKRACSGPCFFCGGTEPVYYHLRNTETPAKGTINLTRDCCEDCAKALGFVW